MSLEDAFLADILQHPEDDTPRLVYADWLDEQAATCGGDEAVGLAARAEFIRVQCRLERTPEDDPHRPGLEDRAAELERVWGPMWARPFRKRARTWAFRRGFVEELWLSTRQFVSGDARLFRQSPLRVVHLRPSAGDLTGLLASPFLRRLAALDLGFNRLDDSGARQLAACPALQALTALDLGHNDLGDEGVEDLSARSASTTARSARTGRSRW